MTYNLLLRSKQRSYKGNNVELLSGRLDYRDYINYIASSKAVIIIYPEDYVMRFSGYFMDSFYCQRPIIITNSKLSKYLKSEYPNSVYVINQISEIFEFLTNREISFDNAEYNKFLEKHSLEETSIQITKLMNQIGKLRET